MSSLKKSPRKARSFKSELAELAEKDPEFYEYLKTEESDILEFDDDGDEDEVGDEQDEVDDAEMSSDDADDNEKEEEGKAEEELEPEKEDEEPEKPEDSADEAETADVLRASDTIPAVKIRRDASDSRKRAVDGALLAYLEAVLSSPHEHREALAAAARVAVDCFKACVLRLGADVSTAGAGSNKKKGCSRQSKKLEKANAGGADAKDKTRGGNSAKKSAGKQKGPDSLESEFVVRRDEHFDVILPMCFARMGRCLMVLLNPVDKKFPAKIRKGVLRRRDKGANVSAFKHWKKHNALAKDYLNALCALLTELQTNDEVVCEALKAAGDIVDLYLHFYKATKQLIRMTVRLWSRKREDVRSAAFIVLCKFVRLDAELAFEHVYRHCYVSYIANCKQVNAETKPLIEFMQRCLVELSFLEPKRAYRYAFVYIRQFAIQLRGAITGKKKDLIPTVYNWQFLNGLALWIRVVAQSVKNAEHYASFRDLCHPLIEILSLLTRSFMSSRYIPLGVFCIRLLLRLQIECRIFIPTLAMAIELLDRLTQVDKTKPSAGKGTERYVDVTESVRFSSLQLQDSGVRSALADHLYQLCADCANALKDSPAFAEIIVPLEPKLKKFIKECRNTDHTNRFKSLTKKLNAGGDDKAVDEQSALIDTLDGQSPKMQVRASKPFNVNHNKRVELNKGGHNRKHREIMVSKRHEKIRLGEKRKAHETHKFGAKRAILNKTTSN